MTSENGCSGSTEDVVILVEELFYLRFSVQVLLPGAWGDRETHKKVVYSIILKT